MSSSNPPDDRRPLPPLEPTVTLGAFRPGTTQGGRYRIESLLGRGGMGEVWQAYDLKLCVDVALKRLHPELLSDSKHLELIRREVRAARDVASPHVCRVFDLVEIEGQELLSMEYIDGSNLNDLLERRGPLELAEASEIAGQLLAGLEAIHQVGLVHRDLKPANVMITRAGRVVVMDFGIAKAMPEAGATAAGPGTIAGTPAYMAPEQTRGEELDARADIFAAGVVLAEMLGVQARDPQTTREQLWRSLHQQPPQIPEGPWKTVLAKAVSSERKARFATARDLARGLEELTQRSEGVEDVTPYPGLSFFTEADARYFFGREFEVEATWKKLHRVPMLAVLGPSGVGKSSFLRAGLLPALPEGWRAIICTPETAPLVSLARALTPELAGDTEAMLDLMHFE